MSSPRDGPRHRSIPESVQRFLPGWALTIRVVQVYDRCVGTYLFELSDLRDREPPEDDSFGDVVPVEAWLDAAVQRLLAEVLAEGEAAAARPLGMLSAKDVMEEIVAAEQATRQAQGRTLTAIAEMAVRRPGGGYANPILWPDGASEAQDGISPFLACEVGLALGVSRQSAANRLDEALALTHTLPKTMAALSAGVLSLPGVRALLGETSSLDQAQMPEVETRVLNLLGRTLLPGLGGMTPVQIAALVVTHPDEVAWVAGYATPGEVRRLARRVVATLDADAARKAKQKTVQSRTVEIRGGGGDGMAWLSGYLEEGHAAAAYERIDGVAWARSHDNPDDPRGIEEWRADVLLDLLLGGTGFGPTAAPVNDLDTDPAASTSPASGSRPGCVVNINVLIDAAGVASVPRLGPVPVDSIQTLLELATRTAGRVTSRVVEPVVCPGVHAVDADDPSVFAGPYETPPAMRRSVQLRDPVCIFPGCVQAATRCDLDHTVPWPHGPTCPCNLGPLCRTHHRLKTLAEGWQLINHGDGTFTWITPTGKHYPV
jgi:Domain of unknown function (DUF222)